MLEFHIARQQIEQTMSSQFRESPEPERPEPERAGIMTTARARLSVALHALARAIEPAASPTVGTPSLKH